MLSAQDPRSDGSTYIADAVSAERSCLVRAGYREGWPRYGSGGHCRCTGNFKYDSVVRVTVDNVLQNNKDKHELCYDNAQRTQSPMDD